MNNYSHCLCPAGFLFFFFLLLLLLALLSLLSSCGFISGLAAPGGRPLETREEIVYMQMRETERERHGRRKKRFGFAVAPSKHLRPHAVVGSLGLPDRLRGATTQCRDPPPRPGPGRNWKLPLILPSSTIRFLSPLLSPFLPSSGCSSPSAIGALIYAEDDHAAAAEITRRRRRLRQGIIGFRQGEGVKGA